MRRSLPRLVPCLACALLVSCAGSGAGLDANGRPVEEGGNTDAPLTADFQSIQDHVFTPICSVCHAGASAPQGLRLDAQNSYALLVGVPSTEVATLLRVRSGDPDNSYLVQKLEGRAAVGAQMPFGGPPLPAATIAVIRQWIIDGAQRPAAAMLQANFAIAAAVPATRDVVTEAPPRVIIAFTRELDATRVDAGTLRLERLAGDMDVVWTPVMADFSVPAANAYTLIATPRMPLERGRYRLLALGAPEPMLSDLGGQPLHADTAEESGERILTRFDVEPTR